MRAGTKPNAALAVAVVALVGASASPRASAGSISAEKLNDRLAEIVDRAGAESGAWVQDPDAGSRRRLLFARRARRSRVLASNQKLFTTATALDRLGSGRRLETRVWRRGGVTARGVLRGDLYLVGAGDPALAGRRFAVQNGLPLTPLGELASEVAEAGITRVRGRVNVDDTIFDRLRGVPASDWQVSPHIGPLAGLTYNSARTGDGYSGDPALAAGRALRDGLEVRGVAVTGKVAHDELPSNGRALVASVLSPKLSLLVEETNRTSNNFFAEMLLKRLAARPGVKGTTRRGTSKVERFAAEIRTRVWAADGSGLSRGNTASPRQVGRLLAGMLERPGKRPFRLSLPLGGRQGTLLDRMRGTAAEGRCRGKTGTLTGVSNLSGYCRTHHGTVVFSILMNGVRDLEQARRLQDRAAALIARY